MVSFLQGTVFPPHLIPWAGDRGTRSPWFDPVLEGTREPPGRRLAHASSAQKVETLNSGNWKSATEQSKPSPLKRISIGECVAEAPGRSHSQQGRLEKDSSTREMHEAGAGASSIPDGKAGEGEEPPGQDVGFLKAP